MEMNIIIYFYYNLDIYKKRKKKVLNIFIYYLY